MASPHELFAGLGASKKRLEDVRGLDDLTSLRIPAKTPEKAASKRDSGRKKHDVVSGKHFARDPTSHKKRGTAGAAALEQRIDQQQAATAGPARASHELQSRSPARRPRREEEEPHHSLRAEYGRDDASPSGKKAGDADGFSLGRRPWNLEILQLKTQLLTKDEEIHELQGQVGRKEQDAQRVAAEIELVCDEIRAVLREQLDPRSAAKVERSFRSGRAETLKQAGLQSSFSPVARNRAAVSQAEAAVHGTGGADPFGPLREKVKDLESALSIEVPCPYASTGCVKKIPASDVTAHKKTCVYREVPCRFSARGCRHVHQYRSREGHEEKCGHRRVHWSLRWEFVRLRGVGYPGKTAQLVIRYAGGKEHAQQVELRDANLIQGTVYAEAHFDQECHCTTDIVVGSSVQVDLLVSGERAGTLELDLAEVAGQGFLDRKFPLLPAFDPASSEPGARNGLAKVLVTQGVVPIYDVSVRDLKERLRRTQLVLTDDLQVRAVGGRPVSLPKGTRVVKVLLEGEDTSLKQLFDLGRDMDYRDVKIMASNSSYGLCDSP